MKSGEVVDANGAFFLSEQGDAGEVLYPTSICMSGWGNETLRGPVTCAALARDIERTATGIGDGDLQPARFTVDLFRPAAMLPLTITSRVLRAGRRIALLEATAVQSDRPIARATALFVRPDDRPAGEIWNADHEVPPVPPADMISPDGPRLFVEDSKGWVPLADVVPSGDRKRAWVLPNDVVPGERITPFQHAAAVSDATNLIVHWGDLGVGYINADVTLNLARLPREPECGLSSEARFEAHGVSQGLAYMYDRDGFVGTVSVVGLASARQGDPRNAGAA